MDYPRLLYRDGDLSLDCVDVFDAEQEAQANSEGFFFYQSYVKQDDNGLQITDEGEETAGEEVDSERIELRALYFERYGSHAPGRMSNDRLREAVEAES